MAGPRITGVPLVAALCVAAVCLSLSTLRVARGQSGISDGSRPAGSPAAQLTGRALLGFDQTVQMVGYYTVIPGLPGELFGGDGPRSEASARFTFRSSPFRVSAIENGGIVHLFSSPAAGDAVLIEVFYDENPNQNFARPDTFSDGLKIAVMRVQSGMTTAVPPAHGINIAGLELLSSESFNFAGGPRNLRSLGRLATITFRSSGPELSGNPLSFPLAVPFGGTVIAAQ